MTLQYSHPAVTSYASILQHSVLQHRAFPAVVGGGVLGRMVESNPGRTDASLAANLSAGLSPCFFLPNMTCFKNEKNYLAERLYLNFLYTKNHYCKQQI